MTCNKLTSVLLLLSIIGVSLGVVTKCYQCGSAGVTGDACSDDNVKSKYSPTTCPAVAGLTYKYCAKGSANDIYVRRCAVACVESDVLKCCDSDGCNGSTAVAVNLVGLVVALFAGVAFIKA